MILSLIDEAVTAGARLAPACGVLGLDPRTVQRWRSIGGGDDRRHGPRRVPSNKLSQAEERRILEIANSREFRDLSPKQIVPKLADRGEYVASESTFYRTLRAAGQLSHRGRAAAPTQSKRPTERVANGPNQVWSWDITYLRSDVLGRFFYLYMIVDVWSRKVVAWDVHDVECGEHATVLLERALVAEKRSSVEVLHSDNGAPMKSATLKATLDRLGITPSYSRPRVSDDNPFSEALFRTMKYRPEYPRLPFKTRAEARRWVAGFVQWYHDEHLHSAIGYVTPLQRHEGADDAILDARRALYALAKANRPNRWGSRAVRAWNAPKVVRLNPLDAHSVESECCVAA